MALSGQSLAQIQLQGPCQGTATGRQVVERRGREPRLRFLRCLASSRGREPRLRFLRCPASLVAASRGYASCGVQLPLVAVSRGYASCGVWLPLVAVSRGDALWPRRASPRGGSSFSCRASLSGSVVVVHGLSCPSARRLFLDRGSNLCVLRWQVDAYSPGHQGGRSCPNS